MISVVIPAHNEFDAVEELVQRTSSVLENLGSPWELILVDDGSTDGTDIRLRQIAETEPRLRVYSTRRQQGQTVALRAGLHRAKGDIVVTLDADLENFPEDIPKLLEKLQPGVDVVVGWRKDREGSWLSRRLPSKLANAVIRKVTRLPIHDQGCGLKVFRRWVINSLFLYGDHHRLISCLCAMHKANLVEVPVRHAERKSGRSKYGLKRTYRVMADILTINLLMNHRMRPFAWFLTMALPFFLAGLGCAYLTFSMPESMIWTGAGLILAITGTTLVAYGLFAELLVNSR